MNPHGHAAAIELTDVSMLAGNHPDRRVVRASAAGRPVVIKCFEDRARAEEAWCVAQLLWESSFGAARHPAGLPQPLALVPLASMPHVAGVTGGLGLVMEDLDGVALGARGDLGTSARPGVLEEAAQLLSDLHRSAVTLPRVRNASALVRSLRRKAADDAGASRRFAPTVEAVAAAVVPDGSLVPSHGDFSPRNVLATPDGLRLIDFDRAQLADPARDVAAWGAWAWAIQLLDGRERGWEIADRFGVAYRAFGGGPLPDRRVRFHRAAALVRIAHGWSALASLPPVRERVLAEARSVLS